MKGTPENLTEGDFEELRRLYYTQSYEIIEELNDRLLRLEADPADGETLRMIKRHMHTLKGDSNSVGLVAIGNLCHKVEDMLLCLSGASDAVDHEAIDILLSAADRVNEMLMKSETGSALSAADDLAGRIDTFLTRSRGGLAVNTPQEAKNLPGQHHAAGEGQFLYSVEIDLDPLCGEKSVGIFMLLQRLNSLGHVISSRPDLESRDMDSADRLTALVSTGLTKEEILREVHITGITAEISASDVSRPEKGSSPVVQKETGIRGQVLKVDVGRVDRLINLVGELIIGHSMIEQVARDMERGFSIEDIASKLCSANAAMTRTVSDLQMGVMKMRMVPVNHVFRRFPRMVRELAAERGKHVRLGIEGRETELDKGIVDALGEPLAHIIRNMVDHGIEEPAGRLEAGKPVEGLIRLRAYHEAAQIVIEVSDDGRGIDVLRLKDKAAEKGYMSADDIQKLSDSEALNLIFIPGLSTSETVSRISGRGIGMDAVKTAVEALKGSVELSSTKGAGTVLRLRLPLTLAVIKALLFEVGGVVYALPISVIGEVLRVMPETLVSMDGRDTLLVRQEVVPVIHLEELFTRGSDKGRKKFVLILDMGRRKTGLVVDRIIGQEELVIKAVDHQYSQAGLASGASILGDGRVVLILDAMAVVKKWIEDEKKEMARV